MSVPEAAMACVSSGVGGAGMGVALRAARAFLRSNFRILIEAILGVYFSLVGLTAIRWAVYVAGSTGRTYRYAPVFGLVSMDLNRDWSFDN